MSDKDLPGTDSDEDSQTIRLNSMFTRDVTSTGSFDIRGDIWASTFGKVVQAMPVPALLIDEYHEVIVANEACSKISAEYEEIIGAPFSRLFPASAAADEAQRVLTEVFSTRRSHVAEGIVQIGRTRIWGRVTYRPIRIVDLRLVLLVVEDLTREKQQILENQRLREELEKRVEQRTADLRESNERLRLAVAEEKRAKEALNRSDELLRLAFDSMTSGVLLVDKSAKVMLANRAAMSILGLDHAIMGQSLREVFPDADIAMISANSPDQSELRTTLQDGTTRLLGLSATSIEADGSSVIVFRDITAVVESRDRKRRAEELALVGEMVSRLSHEIKNPLASIVVGLKTLQRGTPQTSPHSHILLLLSEEVDSLTKTVNQLLEAARPRTPSPRPLYVEPLLERCMDAASLLAVRRGVGLELVRHPASSAVIVDDQAMLRVLQSVVQNALDACSKGGLIRIGWRELDEPEKDQLVPGFSGKVVGVFVEDSGPGIPDDLTSTESRIFRAFVSSKISGSGLGLTVSREIVEAYGGLIIVDSVRDLGTRVEILLPSPEAIPCWDWHKERAADYPSCGDKECADCDMRSPGTGYCCWTVKGRAHFAETGRWPERCLNCGFFRSSSLTPFFKSRLVK